MGPTASPDERMLVLVPVGGGAFDSLLDLGPGLEPSPFQGRERSTFHHASMSGSGAASLPPRPGHRERSPAPGSHRTWRAAFPHHALRQVVHSTFAAIRSRAVSMVSLILSLHRGLSLPLNGAHVAQERVTCRRPLPPGSPVLRVLSAGLTSARSVLALAACRVLQACA